MSHRFLAFTLSILFSFLSHETHASEWGCEVLLCAASSDPSWHSVSECHPPMEKLISAMGDPGFAWPTCPEGGAGKPGYEAYANCPEGTAPAALPNDAGGHGAYGAKSQCRRTVTSCGSSSLVDDNERDTQVSGHAGITRVYRDEHGCVYDEYTARPRRSDPYYFDLQDEETKTSTRHYFDLDR